MKNATHGPPAAEAASGPFPHARSLISKSAVYEKANGRSGVIRVNLNHLRALRRHSHKAGVVLYPSARSEGWRLKITRVSVSEVLDVVDGRWYPETNEYEVPWPALVDYWA